MTPKFFRILFIVADPAAEADVRQKVSEIRGSTFEIITASTLAAALDELQRSVFSVLFVDLAIPDGQGMTALRRLISASTDVPVVIISKSHNEAEALEAVRAGAEDYTVGGRMNSAAFERVILYAIERHIARQRTSLQFFVSRMLAESSSIQEAADFILGALCEFLKCERGELWQSDSRQTSLSLVHSWTSASPSHHDSVAPQQPTTVARGEGVVGQVWETSKQEWIAEATTMYPPYQNQPVVAIPLIVGTGALGVLVLFGEGVRTRDEDRTKLLASVGDQLGQFIARKRAEEERESIASERLLILDSTSEGIFGIDRSGCVTFMNKSAARLFGCIPEQVRGKNAHALFHHTHPDGAPFAEAQCPILRVIQSGAAQRSDQDHFWKVDGSHFAADYSAKAVVKDGHITGAVISFSDISEKRQMEVELRHAQKLEAVGRLAAGIAHEINTPIQFIGDNTHFIQESFHDIMELIHQYERVSEEAAQGAVSPGALDGVTKIREKIAWDYLCTEIPTAMEHALDGVQRVATIVRAMKEFAHIDRNAEKSTVDLNKAIESTLVVASNEFKYVAEVHTDFGSLPPVMCHLGDLNQVFLNLFVNAAHAIGEASPDGKSKGLITVRTYCDGEFVVVAISDTGMGIPESIRGKVFDPFFTTKEVGKGTGQGLALARTIVAERHGGTLTFESEVGKGTTFYVRLPVRGVTELQEAMPA